ncbi:MAG: hypothetical protein K2P58_01680 [Hyphomonadaceae bacterium]|nr:hypothetical protein [Hyphomonadaceae bacterium]
MRTALAAILFAALACPASAAEGPNAREAFVERRGLLEADTRCNLLTPSLRGALEVGAMQARGALLRAGWTGAQMRDLERAVAGAAQGRACNDARTLDAAAQARASFGQWANAGTMEFPGWERSWTARRANQGWRLHQGIDAPIAATFGVRQTNDVQRLALALDLARNAAPPTSAQLVLRDSARAAAPDISLTQRMSLGLAAGAPPASATRAFSSTRSLDRGEHGRRIAVFAFPDEAFAALVALDPHESVELRLTTGRSTQRLYIEVGDIAAARAFLTLQR